MIGVSFLIFVGIKYVVDIYIKYVGIDINNKKIKIDMEVVMKFFFILLVGF